jgi:hypothetical protein
MTLSMYIQWYRFWEDYFVYFCLVQDTKFYGKTIQWSSSSIFVDISLTCDRNESLIYTSISWHTWFVYYSGADHSTLLVMLLMCVLYAIIMIVYLCHVAMVVNVCFDISAWKQMPVLCITYAQFHKIKINDIFR